ncbi:hypothetical protein SODG_000692 [Sodalis praecaptivus]
MSESHSQDGAPQALDLNNELRSRREKLSQLRQQGIAFPNDFRRDAVSDQLHARYGEKSYEELEALNIEVSIAGRMMTRRIMGKASFATLQDVGGKSSCTSPATISPKASTTSSSKNGTSETFSARAANYSKPAPVSCLFTVAKFAC